MWWIKYFQERLVKTSTGDPVSEFEQIHEQIYIRWIKVFYISQPDWNLRDCFLMKEANYIKIPSVNYLCWQVKALILCSSEKVLNMMPRFKDEKYLSARWRGRLPGVDPKSYSFPKREKNFCDCSSNRLQEFHFLMS